MSINNLLTPTPPEKPWANLYVNSVDTINFNYRTYKFSGYQTVKQTIPNNEATLAYIDTVIENDYGFTPGTGNPSKVINVPKDGFYLIIASAIWPSGPNGIRNCTISANGISTSVSAVPGAMENTACSTSFMGQLSTGDIIEFGLLQTSGGDIVLDDFSAQIFRLSG